MTTRSYIGSIERDVAENDAFRHVVATGQYMQLVLMTLMAHEEIGSEVHPRADQFLRVESGEAIVELEGDRHYLGPGGAVLIPAGTRHNVINAGPHPLRLSTLYSPPQHAPNKHEPAPPPRATGRRR